MKHRVVAILSVALLALSVAGPAQASVDCDEEIQYILERLGWPPC